MWCGPALPSWRLGVGLSLPSMTLMIVASGN